MCWYGGSYRGVVHAGAGGNEDAIVCALDLSPTQLRIAGLIALTPKRRGKPSPEMAHIKDSQVVAERWDPKEGKNMTAKVITVTSGKGGVGKTTATANLSAAMADYWKKSSLY